jgi:hypothetical protein
MSEATKRGGMRTVAIALAMLGILALAVPAADAKKKHKGSKGSSVTVSAKTPIAIPASTPSSGGAAGRVSFVAIPLSVGKKAKNMVVSPDSVAVTYSLTGAPATSVPVNAGSLYYTYLSLTAPNGRTVYLNSPVSFRDPNATSVGPLTVTPDSPLFACNIGVTGVPGTTFCNPTSGQDPEGTLSAPNWVGTLGDLGLAWFRGLPAKGTWVLKVRNIDETRADTLTGISMTIGLKPASGGSKKGK